MNHLQLPEITNYFNWFPQIFYTICYLFANSAVVRGFSLIKEPSVGGLIGLMEVIFAASFGIVFFGEQLTGGLLVGGGLLLLAAAVPDLSKLLKLQRRH